MNNYTNNDNGYTSAHDLYWSRNRFEGCYATMTNGKKKKVALCKLCNQTLQNTSIKRLEGHRKSCNNNQPKRFKQEQYMNTDEIKVEFEPKDEIMNESINTSLHIVSAISLTGIEETKPPTFFEETKNTESHLHDDVTPSSSTELTLNCTTSHIGKNVDELITKFFINYNIPFDIVETPTFKELISEINSEYQLPDKNTISSSLLKQIDNDTVQNEMKFAKNESILLIISREIRFLEYEVLTYLYIQEDLKEIFLKLFKFSGKINFTELIQTCSNFARQYYCTNIFGVVCNVDHLHFQKKEFVKNFFDKMITDENEIFYSECQIKILNEILQNLANNKTVTEVFNILREYSCYWDEIKELNDLEENHNLGIYFSQKTSDTLDCMKYVLDNLQEFKDAFVKLIAHDSTKILIKLNLLQDENFVTDFKQQYECMKLFTDLKTKIKLPGASLAEAVQEWVLINENSSYHLFSKTAMQALRPLGIAANILHPVFRGDKLSKEIKDIGEEFLMNYLDSDGLESYECYLSKKEIFQILSKKPNLTWSTYWSLVSRKHPNLSKLAKRLLKMPAVSSSEDIFDTITNQNHLNLENFNKFLHIRHSLKNNGQII